MKSRTADLRYISSTIFLFQIQAFICIPRRAAWMASAPSNTYSINVQAHKFFCHLSPSMLRRDRTYFSIFVANLSCRVASFLPIDPIPLKSDFSSSSRLPLMDSTSRLNTVTSTRSVREEFHSPAAPVWLEALVNIKG